MAAMTAATTVIILSSAQRQREQREKEQCTKEYIAKDCEYRCTSTEMIERKGLSFWKTEVTYQEVNECNGVKYEPYSQVELSGICTFGIAIATCTLIYFLITKYLV